jgi:hypothetical protein
MNNMETQSSTEAPQSKSGKIFFIVFGLLILGSIFATYYRIMIKKNYIIEAQVDCDPYENKCFIWECDPASDVVGEKCTGDAEKNIWYYNLAKRNASKIPLCDSETDDTCAPMICDSEEKDCEQIYCNEENAVEQEATCSDPVEYTKNNPLEEEDDLSGEEVQCEEGDVECEAGSAEAECAPDDAECESGTDQDEPSPITSDVVQ